VVPPLVAEPSGDACDSYHRWREDLDIVAGLGLNAYRFSLEWSRIEPEEGEISRAAVDHYRRMVTGCRDRGIEPVVTLLHFTVPRWFAHDGGWRSPKATERFTRFCEAALAALGDEVTWVCTLNEPNITAVVTTFQDGGPRPELFPCPPDEAICDAQLEAHRAGAEVLHSVPGLKAGYTVACFNFQPTTDRVPPWIHRAQDWWFDQAGPDDFLGVQAYSRVLVGPNGPLPTAEVAERAGNGWEFYPACLQEMLDRAWRLTGGVPLIVTENGIGTDDDAQRVRYLEEALPGVAVAQAAGVDVRGYFQWSLLDNFEWTFGYAHRFGIVSVDRETFARTLKPSARWYSDFVRSGAGRQVAPREATEQSVTRPCENGIGED
jgi:beta-glucosidase